MPRDHIEIPEEKARQAGRGAHVFVIWAISTSIATVGLLAVYALNAVLLG
jgi:hypothetical protein